MPNNTVYTIVADKNGYFWCSSNKGIFRFNPSDYSVLSFTAKDGLQGNEFNRYQFMHFPDSKIAFGGTEGYTIFDPDSINIDNYQPAVALTDVAISNEPISKYPAWNNKAIVSIDTMRLSYNQNFLTFHFAGMEYNNPEKLQYRYMLVSVDKNWVNAGTQNSANYTNLFPGSYDLKLNVSNTAGLWSSHIKIIHIIITSPWWRTWWFYALIVIITAAIIYSIYQYRLKQILKLQGVRNRIATDLHDDIGSALSSINIMSELAKQKSPEAAPLLTSIGESTTTIQENMSDIVWMLKSGNDRFENVLQRMNLFASEILEAKNIELDFSNTETLPALKLTMEQRKNFYLFFKEAINNAAKYSDAEKVSVCIAQKDHSIEMNISDDGKGFDTAKIFNGNGMSSLKKRAAELNGDFKITSCINKGTVVQLKFKIT